VSPQPVAAQRDERPWFAPRAGTLQAP
jgi:hypothetical protein